MVRPPALAVGDPPDLSVPTRRRRWALVAVPLVLGACAGGDGDDTSSGSTSTSVRATTSSTLPPGERDACAVVPGAVVERVTGTAVTSEVIAAIGGGTTCDHRPSEDPAAWTISVFVFERDTEGNRIDARDAFVRFRAESAEPADLPGVGDEAFVDAAGGRAGARIGEVYVDVTAVRFDDVDALVELLRAAVDELG